MDTTRLLSIARRQGLAVGLVADPQADESERWLCTIGFDYHGAAADPTDAVLAALADLVDGGEGARTFASAS